MSAVDEATNLVTAFEGFVPHPYRDAAGTWTIGYGSTRDSAGKPVCATTPNITQEAARKLVERDLGAALTPR